MIIHYSSRIERRRDLGGLCSHNTLCSAVQVDININKLIFLLIINDHYRHLFPQYALLRFREPIKNVLAEFVR